MAGSAIPVPKTPFLCQSGHSPILKSSKSIQIIQPSHFLWDAHVVAEAAENTYAPRDEVGLLQFLSQPFLHDTCSLLGLSWKNFGGIGVGRRCLGSDLGSAMSWDFIYLVLAPIWVLSPNDSQPWIVL